MRINEMHLFKLLVKLFRLSTDGMRANDKIVPVKKYRPKLKVKYR